MPVPFTRSAWVAFSSSRVRGSVAGQAGLSPGATASLLVALSSPEIRQTLQNCCGGWVDRPAAELLAALRDYVSSVEVVHNFEALPPKRTSNGMPGRLEAEASGVSKIPAPPFPNPI